MKVEDDVFGVFFFEEFPGGSDGKESACNAGEPREENGNPLEYSCLENPMDRGAWQEKGGLGAVPGQRLNWHSRNAYCPAHQ